MSPEYALDGQFSVKSDVFSFGVVVLEIIRGEKNCGFYKSQLAGNLLGYVSAALTTLRLEIQISYFTTLMINSEVFLTGLEFVEK